MRKPPLSTKLAIFLARLLLSKYKKKYLKIFNKKLPILIIAGTAGKSSLTLLFKNLFHRGGWDVYTGATPEKCLNSITGLSMVLGKFETDFEGRGAILSKIWFLFKGYFAYLFNSVELKENTILIYEVGFNEQYESEYFLNVFEKDVSQVILTNLTYEHSFGFDKEFDKESYSKIKNNIPKYWQKALEDNQIEGRLKNIALEQFKLLQLTSQFITPLVIGGIDNGLLFNIGSDGESQFYPQVSRNDDFSIKADDFEFGSGFLLPLTLAKNSHILELIANEYGISKAVVSNTLQYIEIPNGRFGLLQGFSGSKIVDSTYNSDPASLLGFLNLFEEVCNSYIQKEKTGNLEKPYTFPPKHTLILGEMRELGEMSKESHLEIIEKLIYLTNQYPKYIEDIFLLGKEWLTLDDKIGKSDGTINFLRIRGQLFKIYLRAGDIKPLLTENKIIAGSWYWIKGSQNTIFLEIITQHLLADKNDITKLCRRGEVWDTIRKKYS
jgi:hypothetical protein